MKTSKYTSLINFEQKKYLFNAISGGLGALKKEFYDESHENLSDFIDKISPDVIDKLKKGLFIIPDDLNELDFIKSLHYQRRFGNNFIGLTMVPTLACNFRCIYCYENDTNYPDKFMSPEVLLKAQELLENSLKHNGIAHIAWYGGEPLLALDIIRRFQTKVKKITSKKNIKVFSSMVTNGYLLTPDIVSELKKLGICEYQVTLDGDEETHNSRRFLINGKGTFSTIIDNLIKMDSDIRVSIRINIDRDNAFKTERIISYLAKLGVNKKKNVSINFGHVANYGRACDSISDICYGTKDFASNETKLYQLLFEKDFAITHIPRPNLSNCAAIFPNSFIIEPDGGIQKCWAAIGDSTKQVGHLLNLEQSQHFVNKHRWLSWDPFSKNECTECNILPLCMGGCPYLSIYEFNSSCNSLKYNLDDILKLIVMSYKAQAYQQKNVEST